MEKTKISSSPAPNNDSTALTKLQSESKEENPFAVAVKHDNRTLKKRKTSATDFAIMPKSNSDPFPFFGAQGSTPNIGGNVTINYIKIDNVETFNGSLPGTESNPQQRSIETFTTAPKTKRFGFVRKMINPATLLLSIPGTLLYLAWHTELELIKSPVRSLVINGHLPPTLYYVETQAVFALGISSGLAMLAALGLIATLIVCFRGTLRTLGVTSS